MIRNQNGYWMSPAFNALFSPDDGAGDGGAGAVSGADGADGVNDGVNDTGADAGDAGKAGEGNQGNNDSSDVQNAEIARLKAELAKQKNALDKATKEAGDARKALKAKMTQEEIDAQAKQEAAEKAAQELEDLRKQVAKGNTVKNVMGKLGLDEDTAGNLADALYGAADIENALLNIQKAWQAKEAAIRKEFGKITGPGAGADSNSPEAMAIKRASELGKARNAQNEQAQKALGAYMR